MDARHARWGRAAYCLTCLLIALLLVVGIANEAH